MFDIEEHTYSLFDPDEFKDILVESTGPVSDLGGVIATTRSRYEGYHGLFAKHWASIPTLDRNSTWRFKKRIQTYPVQSFIECRAAHVDFKNPALAEHVQSGLCSLVVILVAAIALRFQFYDLWTLGDTLAAVVHQLNPPQRENLRIYLVQWHRRNLHGGPCIQKLLRLLAIEGKEWSKLKKRLCNVLEGTTFCQGEACETSAFCNVHRWQLMVDKRVGTSECNVALPHISDKCSIAMPMPSSTRTFIHVNQRFCPTKEGRISDIDNESEDIPPPKRFRVDFDEETPSLTTLQQDEFLKAYADWVINPTLIHKVVWYHRNREANLSKPYTTVANTEAEALHTLFLVPPSNEGLDVIFRRENEGYVAISRRRDHVRLFGVDSLQNTELWKKLKQKYKVTWELKPSDHISHSWIGSEGPSTV